MIWLLYLFQALIVIATVCTIMLQKGSDGLFASNKVFGARGRSNTMIKLTYLLCTIFFINSIALGIVYQRRHKAEMIKAPIINPITTNAKKDLVSKNKVAS